MIHSLNKHIQYSYIGQGDENIIRVSEFVNDVVRAIITVDIGKPLTIYVPLQNNLIPLQQIIENSVR